MNFGTLKSVGHNIAQSLASGVGLMIGVYELDVFGEAARSPEGFVEVDFLTGQASGGRPSEQLARALVLYAEALPEFCQKHGVDVGDFQELTARYEARQLSAHFSVTVEDRRGMRSIDNYVGFDGARPKVLDHLGRVRKI